MRKLIKKYLPDPEKLRQYRLFSLLGTTLLHPALWHLNRRSAAGGVAVGLFCGLIPGPLQMLGALLACLVFHVNLPLAVLCTFYTNPLTIIPLYLVAFQIGRWVLGNGSQFVPPPPFDWQEIGASFEQYLSWMAGLGKPLALGLPLLAVGLAIAGYVIVTLLWRLHLVREIKKRASRNPLR